MKYISRPVVPIIALTFLIVASIAVQAGVEILADQIITTGLPWWVPTFGTIGETMLTYSLLASILSFVILPIAVFTLGYHSGRRHG